MIVDLRVVSRGDADARIQALWLARSALGGTAEGIRTVVTEAGTATVRVGNEGGSRIVTVVLPAGRAEIYSFPPRERWEPTRP